MGIGPHGPVMADTVNLWVAVLPTATAFIVGLVLLGVGLYLRRRSRRSGGA